MPNQAKFNRIYENTKKQGIFFSRLFRQNGFTTIFVNEWSYEKIKFQL